MGDGTGTEGGVEQVIADVACTVCGCVCDDLRVHVRGGRIVRADGACRLAEPWFLGQDAKHPPTATIEGRAVSLDEAVFRAADILRDSRAPLIYGLSRSTTEGQRAAVALADRVGATIDTTASLDHAPSIIAFQQAGEPTCTLGEVRTRADLVIFWGCDPDATHPRHLERYARDPLLPFEPERRREIVYVDVQSPISRRSIDTFISIDPDRHFEALWTLRNLIRNPSTDSGPLAALAGRMRTCRYGIVFFGLGLSQVRHGHRNVEALLRLVTDLNAFTRFSARRLRMQGDVAGADSVLCWQTGYPFSVNLARGYPRYNPGEFSAGEMLARREADTLLLLGSEYEPRFPPAARSYLRTIPTIVLDSPTVEPEFEPTVRFTTAVYGVHRSGTAYRMDEVPIPLRVLLPSDYPSDADALGAIIAALTKAAGRVRV